MELLNAEEIRSIVKPFGSPKVMNWSLENYSNEMIGYLGEHFRLKIDIDSQKNSQIRLFVKCMPRTDQWLAKYLKELSFFEKEYVMLSDLFQHFKSCEESEKWRPKPIFIRKDLFVFEDVSELGYEMRCNQYTLSYEEIMATIKAVAKFHAQSLIFEENKSKKLKREYRIWEDYREHLKEPTQTNVWRNTGRNAVIDYLKEYSKHKTRPNFYKNVETVIDMLFEKALTLMKPNPKYRNVIVHRDLWINNIFFKILEDGQIHALIVDFQTVLYSSPMLDISSFLFFNTTRAFRNDHISEVLEYYYKILSAELKCEDIDVDSVFNKSILNKAYEDSVIFGITQAALITPITVMNASKRKELFQNPATVANINTVSRSAEFIEVARHDDNYRERVTELFDEIVERFVFPENTVAKEDYLPEQ